MYSAAGPGESTTDLAWDGHAIISENDELLAEAERFAADAQMITADIDLERLLQERMRTTSFSDSAADCMERLRTIRSIEFEFAIPNEKISLRRNVPRFPYVPNEAAARDQRCYEAYNIQVHGLMKRLASTGLNKVVIGVSGGLDSTQALIVAAKTMDRLNLPRRNVLAYTMPGFATSDLTLRNAQHLMEALGVTAELIDIKPSCLQMFRDIRHPYAEGRAVFDVTFENVQAGERTSHLFRLANLHNGLVLGTGDLSELALGWTTYGVGDQMSHYNVNVSVPKTLIQYLIRWVATSGSSTLRQTKRWNRLWNRDFTGACAAPAGQRRSAGSENSGFNRARTNFRTSVFIILHGSVCVRAKSRFWPTTRGATRKGAIGRTSFPPTNAPATTWRRSRNGWAFFCIDFSRRANLSAPLCRTGQKLALAVPFRRGAIGARRRTPSRMSGSANSRRMCRFSRREWL